MIIVDDGKVDYIFPGSDDELNALELYETDGDQGGTDGDTCLGLDNLERVDQSQSPGTCLKLVAYFYGI